MERVVSSTHLVSSVGNQLDLLQFAYRSHRGTEDVTRLLQHILILERHIGMLLKFRVNPTYMAPFSVNITRTELCSVMGRFRSGVGLGFDH